MNSNLYNAIGFAGVSLIGASFWAIHPAVTAGFAGCVLVVCSVWMARHKQKGKA